MSMRAACLLCVVLGAAGVLVGVALRTTIVASAFELRSPRRDRGVSWIAFGVGMMGIGLMGLTR